MATLYNGNHVNGSVIYDCIIWTMHIFRKHGKKGKAAALKINLPTYKFNKIKQTDGTRYKD